MSTHARRNRFILITGATIVIVCLLYVARGALFPFIIAGLLAYLLIPLVRLLERITPWRERWPKATRLSAIFLINAVAVALLVGFLATVIPLAVRETTHFIEGIPDLYNSARETLESLNDEYTRRVPENVRAEIQEAMEGVSGVVVSAAQGVLLRTAAGVQHTLSFVIALAIMPIFLFYLLKDQEELSEGFFSILHPSLRRHVRNVLAIADRTVGAYLRGQLILGVFVGVLVFAGLTAMGIPFAVLLGIISGVTELFPVIGPILGAIPGLLVTLAHSPEKFVWVLVLYVGVQQVENTLLVPRIQGEAVHLHPAVVMVVLIVGSEVAGIWGMVVAVPLAGVARDVFVYFLNEWRIEEAAPPVDTGGEAATA
jgi:predicted PurR-regulated permease PerM